MVRRDTGQCEKIPFCTLPINDPLRQDNHYKVVLAPGYTHGEIGIAGGVPREVHFVAYSDLPLPSPKYLRIHAHCCRIAHMSGAAEYLDIIYRDMEELKVLAADGTSADVLDIAISGLVAPV